MPSSSGGAGAFGTGGAMAPISSGGATGSGGAVAVGSGGSTIVPAGSGGSGMPMGSGGGGASSTGGGGGGGRGGVIGTGGRVGSGGGGGVGGGAGGSTTAGSGGVSGTGGGAGRGGAVGTGGRVGSGGNGGTPVTTVCTPGTNRCVAGDLQTCSTAGVWQSTGTSTRQLLVNPGFESGETAWMVSVAGGFPLVYLANGSGADNTPQLAAQSPPNLAWFGGYQRADDIVTQTVLLPAGATSMTISFDYAIFTNETTAVENDVMDVQLTAGTQTIALAHFSDNSPPGAWMHFSAPLPNSLAGQTVTLRFEDTTNATLLTSFYIDSVALQAVACP